MVRQCCKCKKLDFLNPGLSFHKFPRDQTNRQIWLAILCLENRTVPKTADVCSDHFDKQDMTYNSRGSCILKNNVFPKYKLIETQIQRESLQEQFFEPTIKTEVTEKSSDNQHMNDIKVFANWLIKSEETPTKEENKIKEKNSFDISLANYIDIQVKVETTETGDEVDKFNECLFDDNTIKNEEVFVKEELLEAEENSSSSSYCGQIKKDGDENDRSQLLIKQSFHQSEYEMEYEVYRCSDCSYQTPLKTNLRKHQTRHNNPLKIIKYTCKQCGYETFCEGLLKQHILRHEGTHLVNVYKCSGCDYQTLGKEYILRHLRRHGNKDKFTMHRRKRCDYKIYRKYYHQEEDFTNPDESKKHKCDYCYYQTMDKYYFKRHILIHKYSNLKKWEVPEDIDNIYKCHDCGFKSIWKCALRNHIIRFHVNHEVKHNVKC